MKTWSQYFETKNINESHKKTKKEQIEWICSIMDKLSEKEVEDLYNYIENKFDLK